MNRAAFSAQRPDRIALMVRPVLVATMALVAGSEWHRVFGWSPLLREVVVAAMLPAVIALVCRLRRVPVELAIVLSVVALLWWLGPGVLHDTVGGVFPNAHVFADATTGLQSWDRLLTSPLPIAPEPQLIVLPVVTTWVAAAVGCEIAIRTRFAMLAVLPASAAFVLALAFGIGGPGSRLVPAVVFVGAAALLAATSSRSFIGPGARSASIVARSGLRSRPVFGRTSAAIGVVAVAALVAALVGPSMPGLKSSPPYNPRAHRVPPTIDVATVNPLVELSNWAEHPGAKLFTVTASRREPQLLAALDTWSANGGFSVTAPRYSDFGTGLSAPSLQVPVRHISEQVRVQHLPGPWLPMEATAVAVTGVHALADFGDRTIVAASGRAAGSSYSVESVVPAHQNACDLFSVVPAGSESVGLPPRLVSLAQLLVRGESTPCQQAERIDYALHHAYHFAARAPSGTIWPILQHFLFTPASKGGGKGTSEQFASAFVLMARALGMQSRVVVGFIPPKAGSGRPVEVTGKDATALAQVDFVGLGWVSFDPTPLKGNAVVAPPKVHIPKQQASHSGGTSSSKFSPTGTTHRATTTSGALPGWAVPVLAIAVVLLVLVAISVTIALGFRRRRRRRRLSAAGARARIHGAWLESVDSLRDLDIAAPTSMTTTEVVQAAREQEPVLVTDDLVELATLDNSAVFDRGEPGSEEVEAAWRHSDEVTAAALRQLGWVGRAQRAVDIRVVIGSAKR